MDIGLGVDDFRMRLKHQGRHCYPSTGTKVSSLSLVDSIPVVSNLGMRVWYTGKATRDPSTWHRGLKLVLDGARPKPRH